MKKILITPIVFLLVGFLPGSVKAQFLQNVLNSVKQTVQNKANSKASQATDKAIDKIDPTTKKTPATPPAQPANTGNAPTPAPPPAGNTNSTKDDPGSDNSFIKLNVSAHKMLIGETVIISGSSIKYGNFNQVSMTISGSAKSETKSIPLVDTGSYKTTWQPSAAGEYKITIKSSDGKSQASATLNVYGFVDMELITGPGKEETKKAFDNLVKWVNIVKTSTVQKDADDVQKKMKDITSVKDRFLKLLDDLTSAGKGLDGVEKKYSGIPTPVTENLSKLNDALSEQANQMESLNSIADHAPSDNTICEYLVMVKEACAAFSTVTNFMGKGYSIIISLAADKVVPGAVASANSAIGTPYAADAATQECAKLFASAKLETEAWHSNFNAIGFAIDDLGQFCADGLLKKYCVVMTGDLKENYQCTFKNSSNIIWWKYTYTTEATVSIRYPKDNSGGSVIKMKGNIEGNATKFTIYQKASEIDDFKNAMKDRAQLYSILLYAPPTMPFASSKADKNTGFGALFRAVVTPAYFNIPIDGDYDVSAKKIKLYLNTPLMDFNPSLVSYIYCYITFPLGIPLTTRVNYPINPVKLTLGKVIKENDDFDITGDPQNGLIISKVANFTIGKGSAVEHNIDFTLSMKSE